MTYTAKNVYELNFVSRWLKFCMMAFSPKPILEYAVGLLFSQPWVVASHHVPDMSAMLRLPWQQPLPSNGALYIQQLWASGGRTREPNLMKLGIQQQIGTAMTVT